MLFELNIYLVLVINLKRKLELDINNDNRSPVRWGSWVGLGSGDQPVWLYRLTNCTTPGPDSRNATNNLLFVVELDNCWGPYKQSC